MAAPRAEISTEVAIIGSGPAGLAAAAQLARQGVTDILIIERDDAPGGLPRFCHHPGFGWEYSRRLDTGPGFVRRLLAELPPNARILLGTTALCVLPGPMVDIVGPETGLAQVRAKAVLIATGIREQSRGGRLIPGTRPEHGLLTTGLLQQLVARDVRIPTGRMAIIGSEHVAFSAILTGRRAGLHTVALVESHASTQSWRMAELIARIGGTPVLLSSQMLEILGRDHVEAIVVRDKLGQVRKIECEYVLFSGAWIPEAALLAESGGQLDHNSGGPVVDQFLRTSIPAVFAAGNVLRPVESSGRAALEGTCAGRIISGLLRNAITRDMGSIRVEGDSALSYIVPQRWATERTELTPAQLSFRGSKNAQGRIVVSADGTPRFESRRIRIAPNRQSRLFLQSNLLGLVGKSVSIRLQPMPLLHQFHSNSIF